MKKLHCLPIALTCSLLVAALCGCNPAPRDADGAPAVDAATAQSLTQTFSWQGLTLRHPSNYVISDKEYDGESYDFCCEIDGDDISMVQFSIVKDDDGDFENLSKEEIRDCLEVVVRTVCREFQEKSAYADLRFGSMDKDASGPYLGVSRDFNGKIMGMVSLSGKVAVIYGKGKIVSMVVQAENSAYLQTLLGIVGSVRLE